MSLTDEQKQALTRWVGEGMTLSDIQKKLASDFGLKMTYMDVRFLVIELGLSVKDKQTPPPPKPTPMPPPSSSEEEPEDGADDLPDEDIPGDGTVKVELSRLSRPGALVSGKVTFSDGVTGDWWLDQYGRLALDPGDKNYRPKQGDIQQFQVELKRLLQSRGF